MSIIDWYSFIRIGTIKRLFLYDSKVTGCVVEKTYFQSKGRIKCERHFSHDTHKAKEIYWFGVDFELLFFVD